jgi:hypothetical protein
MTWSYFDCVLISFVKGLQDLQPLPFKGSSVGHAGLVSVDDEAGRVFLRWAFGIQSDDDPFGV